jgi:hypothetical protein
MVKQQNDKQAQDDAMESSSSSSSSSSHQTTIVFGCIRVGGWSQGINCAFTEVCGSMPRAQRHFRFALVWRQVAAFTLRIHHLLLEEEPAASAQRKAMNMARDMGLMMTFDRPQLPTNLLVTK